MTDDLFYRKLESTTTIDLVDMKKELIGRVISVQYFEQTENTSTHIKSLRFPVFLELKEEGQLPNN